MSSIHLQGIKAERAVNIRLNQFNPFITARDGLLHEGKNWAQGAGEQGTEKDIGLKREKVTKDWKNYIMRSFMISVPRHVLLHR